MAVRRGLSISCTLPPAILSHLGENSLFHLVRFSYQLILRETEHWLVGTVGVSWCADIATAGWPTAPDCQICPAQRKIPCTLPLSGLE